MPGGEDIDAAWGDGPKPDAPVTAPLRDITRWQADGLGCRPLPAGSLAGAIALIQRGDCAFVDKVFNAEDAGAVGVVIVQRSGADIPIPPLGLAGAVVPAVMIGSGAGQRLKSLLARTPTSRFRSTRRCTPCDTPDFNSMAGVLLARAFIGSAAIKPEIVAVGADVYTATQKTDPTGALYDPSGYIGVSGTSFAAPMVAGAAALVKQAHPGYTPAQIKSAVVNTATSDVTDDGGQARITSIGGGKLDARAAVASSLTVTPATLSFGQVLRGSQPVRLTLEITNTGSSAVDLTVAAAPRTTDNKGRIAIAAPRLTVDAGKTEPLGVALEGDFPDAGSYEGYVTIDGAGTQLRIPYLYIVTDGRPGNAFPVLHGEFTGVVNDPIPWVIAFKLVDRYGLPVANTSVRFSVVDGGGSVKRGDAATDKVGIAGGRGAARAHDRRPDFPRRSRRADGGFLRLRRGRAAGGPRCGGERRQFPGGRSRARLLRHGARLRVERIHRRRSHPVVAGGAGRRERSVRSGRRERARPPFLCQRRAVERAGAVGTRRGAPPR